MNTYFLSPTDICHDLAIRAKTARLAANLSQAGLAERAGVSLGSLRRFESSGAASLELVARVALALKAEDGFAALFKPQTYTSLDEALNTSTSRKRGRNK